MVIVIVVKDDDPVQLRMDDIYDHSFVSTIQHHVHHISNSKSPRDETSQTPATVVWTEYGEQERQDLTIDILISLHQLSSERPIE